ncbi:MAG: hypothetical protein GTO63_35385, partial [Anaerolineae bacterium]|nr:hypothetical protein [Anaerolineae bacterium]NIN99984.1 hypothetical protein [Anaerolineae bacterium]NIQ82751.1 hypothetical protein [Anaerolineae bacterium]
MIISNSPDFTAAAWEPFQAEKAWTLAPDPKTDVAIVYVKYRDEQGLESTIETDGIRVMPSGSLGSIKGKGLLEGQTDHSGILVMAPDNSFVQATFTTEAGDFLLADLLPGQYNLLLTRPSYLPQEVTGVTVNAGEVTDIGTITLVRE